MSVAAAGNVLEMDGRFERGQIVLESPPAWPEGARLHLRVTMTPAAHEKERLERLLALAGSVPDLERPPQGEYEARGWPE